MHGWVSVLNSSPNCSAHNCSQMFLQVLETQLSHKQKTLMLLQCCQEESPFCSSSKGIGSCESPGHLPLPHTTTSMLHGVGIVPLVIIQHAAEARQL